VSVPGRSIVLLDRRDWVYVLSLLVPLVAYDLTLKIVSILSEYPDFGVWGALRLLRSVFRPDKSGSQRADPQGGGMGENGSAPCP